MNTPSTTPSPTAEFLTRAIAFSGRSQRDIAEVAGFPKPNALSMMKTGDMKVPIDRIPALADACDVDAAAFVRVAMQEYQPDVWQTILRAVGEPMSADETDLLSIYRITKKQHGIHLAKTAGEMILGLLFLLEDKTGGCPEGP